MKLFKKMLSVLLSAVIMVGMACVCMVSVAAEKVPPNYIAYKGYENGNYYFMISGFLDEEIKFLETHKKEGSNIYIDFESESDYYYIGFNYTYMSAYGGNTSGDYFPITSNGLKKTNGNWEITFAMESSTCAKLIKFLKNQSTCNISVQYIDNNYQPHLYYDSYIGFANIKSYEEEQKKQQEDKKKEEDKKAAIAALGNPPSAKGKSSNRNYSVSGYYNSDKTKYCVKIDGITKEEYKFLQDCKEYYGLLDSDWNGDGITIQIANKDKEQKEYGSLIQAIIDKNGEIYSLNKDYLVSFQKNSSLTGEFVKSEKGYAYIFYIDLRSADGRKTAKVLSKTNSCNAEIRIEYHRFLQDATSKSGYKEEHYSYYYKDTKIHEYTAKCSYSKTTKTGNALSKPTLKATKKSDTKAVFSWSAVKGAEKYQIYYSTNGGKYKKLATVSGSKTSYTNSKLDFKKNDYKFRIRAYAKADGKTVYGAYSKAVTVK